MSYEAGIKTMLFDRRLRFNLTGYYFKTKDLQGIGGRRRCQRQPAAQRRCGEGDGFETELETRPVTGLTLDRRPQLQPDPDPRR